MFYFVLLVAGIALGFISGYGLCADQRDQKALAEYYAKHKTPVKTFKFMIDEES